MANSMPYFPFYHMDWLGSSGTREMSLAARGLYIDLLCYQWEDGYIPEETPRLLKRFHLSETEFLTLWEEIKHEFKSNGIPGQLVQARLAKEREKVAGIYERNRENGRKGGRPTGSKKPKENQPVFLGKPKNNRTAAQSESESDIDINKSPSSAREDESHVESLETFYREGVLSIYPDRSGPKHEMDGLRAYAVLHADGYCVKELNDAVAHYWKWADLNEYIGTRFVMCIDTFFSKDNWKPSNYPLTAPKSAKPANRAETATEAAARLNLGVKTC